MMESQQLKEILQFSRNTIEQAGSIAMKYFRAPVAVDNKSDDFSFDPVTEADREIESFVRDKITKSYPGHTIVGEEHGISMGSDDIKWFIDPIDGTRAFISGVPIWGILLGLMTGEDCQVGIMHQPYLRETYTGSVLGSFASKGDTTQQVFTSKTTDLNKAILYCTHPDIFPSDEDFTAFKKVAGVCRMMRYGGDCYSYCLLANGFIDLVIEADLKAHDIIPLIPIVESAGGIVTDWSGGSAVYGGSIIAAANESLHEKVLAVIEAG